MRSRLVKFLTILILLLFVLEGVVRVNGKYFHALSDRMLFKAKILERETDTKVLFLGTSRLLDGVNHQVFSKELESISGHYFKSLNGATTGLQNERLAYFSQLAAENAGLTHVVIEVSPPAMADGTMKLPELEGQPQADPVAADRFADRVENRLQKSFINHVALVKYRKALRPRTFSKLLILYTANIIDPNIWSRKRPLEAIFLPANVTVTKVMEAELVPVVTKANAKAQTQPEGKDFANLEKIANIFKDSSIDVIWVAPPVSEKAILKNHNHRFSGFYQAIANQTGASFYDYAGIGFDKAMLRDGTHLNPKGRDLFSKLLARHLAGHFSSKK